MAERHEVMPGDPTARATFTGSADGGGTQAGGCGHEHTTQAEALACAEAEADAIAARSLAACEPPGLEALRQAVAGEFGTPVE
jgi:hypothetical protein